VALNYSAPHGFFGFAGWRTPVRGVYVGSGSISSGDIAGSALAWALLKAPSGKICELMRASITSAGTVNQQFRCAITRATTDGTSPEEADDPEPTEAGDQDSASTFDLGPWDADPTPGVVVAESSQNALAGWIWETVRDGHIFCALPCWMKSRK
jgi:hypothetical protein